MAIEDRYLKPSPCIATSRKGVQCKLWAIPGGTVCRFHGGATPRVKAAAERRLLAAQAERAVAVYGLPVNVAPEQALLEEIHRTAGHVAWLGAKVAGFEADDELKQRDMSGKFEKPSVWVELYQAERAHLAKVAKAALDAGVAERAVQVAESQGRQLADVLQGVLGDVFAALEAAGLDMRVLVEVKREAVPTAIRRRLMELGESA